MTGNRDQREVDGTTKQDKALDGTKEDKALDGTKNALNKKHVKARGSMAIDIPPVPDGGQDRHAKRGRDSGGANTVSSDDIEKLTRIIGQMEKRLRRIEHAVDVLGRVFNREIYGPQITEGLAEEDTGTGGATV